MIGMSMRQNRRLYHSHVDSQKRYIMFDRNPVWSTVEQDSANLIIDFGGQYKGNAKTGETKALAGEILRSSLHNVIRFVRDAVRNRGQSVADIVDKYENFGTVQNRNVGSGITQSLNTHFITPAAQRRGE